MPGSARSRHRAVTPVSPPAPASSVPPVAADEPVVLIRVSDEIQAEMFCGLLRSNGIQCGHRETQAIDSPLEDFTGAGPREILVHADDLETARELLPVDSTE